jgi:protein gp37
MSKKKRINNPIKNPEMSDNQKNWNVVTGCDKYSDGCLNCYAEDIVEWKQRLRDQHYLKHGFNLTMRHNRLNWPLTNLSKRPRKPAKSFVTDMGDPFHDKVTDEFIFKIFEVMLKVPQHRFYVLTKRAERFGKLGPHLPWRPWIWAGVTVESDKYIDRIDHLKNLPPEVNKFIMMEPLLSSMPELNLAGINWVVVGGESNKKMRFRPMKEEWVVNIRDQVKKAGLPFMFKHWPGKTHNAKEALLEGKIWAEYPKSLLVNREWDAKIETL